MRSGFENDFLPRLSVSAHGELISHSAGRHKKGGRVPRELRGSSLQTLYRWILAKHIVTDFRLGHTPAHFGRRQSDGVAAKVNPFWCCAFGHGLEPNRKTAAPARRKWNGLKVTFFGGQMLPV